MQATYNVQVQVSFLGKQIPLLQAVKFIGGLGREEKRWSEASREEGQSGRMRRWEKVSHNDPRDSEKEYPERQMAMPEIEKASLEATKNASLLREAISKGNGKVIEMEFPDGLLIDGQ